LPDFDLWCEKGGDITYELSEDGDGELKIDNQRDGKIFLSEPNVRSDIKDHLMTHQHNQCLSKR
jgi:hypothetical protein